MFQCDFDKTLRFLLSLLSIEQTNLRFKPASAGKLHFLKKSVYLSQNVNCKFWKKSNFASIPMKLSTFVAGESYFRGEERASCYLFLFESCELIFLLRASELINCCQRSQIHSKTSFRAFKFTLRFFVGSLLQNVKVSSCHLLSSGSRISLGQKSRFCAILIKLLQF